MAFIYCRTCGWEQDDFWDPNAYHPFRQDIIDHLKESLFQDKVYLDKWLFDDMELECEEDEEGYFVSGKDFVAKELERKAKSIRNMVFPQEKDWKNG